MISVRIGDWLVSIDLTLEPETRTIRRLEVITGTGRGGRQEITFLLGLSLCSRSFFSWTRHMSSLLVAIYELAAALQSTVLASCTWQVDPGVAWIQWQRRKFRTTLHYRLRRSPLQMLERFCLPRWWPLSQTTCTLEYSRAAHQFRRGSPFPNFFAHYDSL